MPNNILYWKYTAYSTDRDIFNIKNMEQKNRKKIGSFKKNPLCHLRLIVFNHVNSNVYLIFCKITEDLLLNT